MHANAYIDSTLDTKQKYLKGAHILLNDLYVDNFITGAETVERAIEIRNEITEILSSGGFCIRQWASNDARILSGLQEDQIDCKLD